MVRKDGGRKRSCSSSGSVIRKERLRQQKPSEFEFRNLRKKKGNAKSTDSEQYVKGVNKRRDNREHIPRGWKTSNVGG